MRVSTREFRSSSTLRTRAARSCQLLESRQSRAVARGADRRAARNPSTHLASSHCIPAPFRGAKGRKQRCPPRDTLTKQSEIVSVGWVLELYFALSIKNRKSEFKIPNPSLVHEITISKLRKSEIVLAILSACSGRVVHNGK